MEQSGQSSPHEVWHVGPAASARLADLGLSEDDLRVPLDLALADARLCTTLDAPGAAGFVFWTRSNRYFRERMIPQGWTWTSRDNILRTVDPKRSFTISAVSGAGAVGVEGGRVQTRNPKGTAVARLVRYNYAMYGGPRNAQALFDIPEDFEPDMLPTWFHLYKLTAGGIVQELSLPVDMEGKAVNKWREHIVLPIIEFPDGGPAVGEIDIFNDPDDLGPDVPVERIA